MKKEEKIYCVLVVIVLIVVFFGDQIMLKIIPSNPNLNNTTFGGEEKKELIYDNPYVTKITLEQLMNKLNAFDSFIVIFTRSNCFTCDKLMNNLEYMKDSKLPIYYVDRDTYNEDRQIVKNLANYDDKLKDNIDLTPFIIKVNKGMIDSTIIGTEKEEKIKDFFLKI